MFTTRRWDAALLGFLLWMSFVGTLVVSLLIGAAVTWVGYHVIKSLLAYNGVIS